MFTSFPSHYAAVRESYHVVRERADGLAELVLVRRGLGSFDTVRLRGRKSFPNSLFVIIVFLLTRLYHTAIHHADHPPSALGHTFHSNSSKNAFALTCTLLCIHLLGQLR